MPKITTVAAASFKARCLELMDRVRETRETYVVTKHGKPVAKLVPYDDVPARPFFGSMAGTVIEIGDASGPIPGEWFTDPLLTPLSPMSRPPRRPSGKRR